MLKHRPQLEDVGAYLFDTVLNINVTINFFTRHLTIFLSKISQVLLCEGFNIIVEIIITANSLSVRHQF
jgi:hypothetical protein